ncbi:unnamed protein product [Closterium sp. Naga37s-1]|nr:unnamed protein product [Closterium sp. Naga37s-1]
MGSFNERDQARAPALPSAPSPMLLPSAPSPTSANAIGRSRSLTNSSSASLVVASVLSASRSPLPTFPRQSSTSATVSPCRALRPSPPAARGSGGGRGEDPSADVSREFPNGDSYRGQWGAAWDVPHGAGCYVWADGSVYEGEWARGEKHGQGLFVWPSGARYKGEWARGQMQGVGSYWGADGSFYTGNWAGGVKHGLGRKLYPNGDRYEGFWSFGAAHGPGRYVWANGNEYFGEWEGGTMSGCGTFTWASGERYEGEWEGGVEHGVGVFAWRDGSRYEGTWSRGLKDGKGVFYPAGCAHGAGDAGERGEREAGMGEERDGDEGEEEGGEEAEEDGEEEGDVDGDGEGAEEEEDEEEGWGLEGEEKGEEMGGEAGQGDAAGSSAAAAAAVMNGCSPDDVDGALAAVAAPTAAAATSGASVAGASAGERAAAGQVAPGAVLLAKQAPDLSSGSFNAGSASSGSGRLARRGGVAAATGGGGGTAGVKGVQRMLQKRLTAGTRALEVALGPTGSVYLAADAVPAMPLPDSSSLGRGDGRPSAREGGGGVEKGAERKEAGVEGREGVGAREGREREGKEERVVIAIGRSSRGEGKGERIAGEGSKGRGQESTGGAVSDTDMWRPLIGSGAESSQWEGSSGEGAVTDGREAGGSGAGWKELEKGLRSEARGARGAREKANGERWESGADGGHDSGVMHARSPPHSLKPAGRPPPVPPRSPLPPGRPPPPLPRSPLAAGRGLWHARQPSDDFFIGLSSSNGSSTRGSPGSRKGGRKCLSGPLQARANQARERGEAGEMGEMRGEEGEGMHGKGGRQQRGRIGGGAWREGEEEEEKGVGRSAAVSRPMTASHVSEVDMEGRQDNWKVWREEAPSRWRHHLGLRGPLAAPSPSPAAPSSHPGPAVASVGPAASNSAGAAASSAAVAASSSASAASAVAMGAGGGEGVRSPRGITRALTMGPVPGRGQQYAEGEGRRGGACGALEAREEGGAQEGARGEQSGEAAVLILNGGGEGEACEVAGVEAVEDAVMVREYVHGVLVAQQPLSSHSHPPVSLLSASFSLCAAMPVPVAARAVERWHVPRGREGKRAGELIYKGHRSYLLMRTLQLGLRTHMLIPPPIHTPLVPPNRYSVGRITPDAQRDVGPADFSHWPAVRFPPAGSPTTPPHSMHAFKWRDYCPSAFRALRAMFGIDPGDYMVSLCGDDALRELSSPGKSGSVFFLSHDDRFLIKTMRSAELQVLLRMLPAYYRHVKHNPHTLLTKFFGLHAIKIYHTTSSRTASRLAAKAGGRESVIRFVVMANLLVSPLRVHRRFDLKGSSQGRSTGKVAVDDTTTLKDLDLDLAFLLHPPWRPLLLQQIAADCAFLEQQHIMDYSLLLGVHFKATGPPPAPIVTITDAHLDGPSPASLQPAAPHGTSATAVSSMHTAALLPHCYHEGNLSNLQQHLMAAVRLISATCPQVAPEAA